MSNSIFVNGGDGPIWKIADSTTITSTMIPDWPTGGGYTTRIGWPGSVNQPRIPEETVSVKVFEYIVINIEFDPSVIVAGPTCIIAECADEARVAAGQATASLAIPASSLKVLVRQFA